MSIKSRISVRSTLEVLLLVAIILTGVAALVVWRFGAVGNALAYLHGASLVPDKTVIDFGDVDARSTVKGSFALHNLTTGVIRITGSRGSCDCTVVDALPMNVGPGEKKTIEVSVSTGSKTESWEHIVELYLDKAGPPLRLIVKGRTRSEARPSQNLAKKGTGG